MKKRRFQRTAFFTIVLLLLLTGSCVLWLRAQQRQYALNRQLIGVVQNFNTERILTLINRGADPNTHYIPLPAPSFQQLLDQLLRRAKAPVNESPTAFLIVCGALWNDGGTMESRQANRPDDATLALAMVTHGANVNAHTKDGESALLLLTRCDHSDMIRVLLEHGANVGARTKDGDTALLLAARNSCSDTVDLLLAHGANVNAQNTNGATALCDALAYSANKRIIRQLLAHGADPNLADDEGQNALYIAQRQQAQSEIIALLLQQGAKKKKPDPPTFVPAIARLLGVRVGYNGQDALTDQFGDGLHTVGGHPGGQQLWYTRHPAGMIDTDGVNYNEEGLALESLFWGLESTTDPSIPFIRRFPRHAGWLGVVYPGMTMAQVAQLTADKLPAPQRQGNIWMWTEKGFVRPSPVNDDVYTAWTAKLTFRNRVLESIDLRVVGGSLAP